MEDERGATATDTAVVNTLAVPAAPPKYELSISIVPLEGGTVTLDPPGGIYDEGTEVMVTAEPADSYEFDHWSGDVSGVSSSVTVTMDSGKSITAHFRSISEGGPSLIRLGVGVTLFVIVIFSIIAIHITRKRR